MLNDKQSLTIVYNLSEVTFTWKSLMMLGWQPNSLRNIISLKVLCESVVFLKIEEGVINYF